MAERGSRQAAVLAFVTIADLGLYGLSYAVWPHTPRLHAFVSQQAFPPAGTAPVAAENQADVAAGLHVGNRLLLAGFRRADGYAGLEPRKELDYTQPATLRLAGVHWQAGSQPGEWLPIADPLPPVRRASEARVDHQQPDAWQNLPAGAVLVEQPLDLPPSEPGTLRLESPRPGRFQIECRRARPASRWSWPRVSIPAGGPRFTVNRCRLCG